MLPRKFLEIISQDPDGNPCLRCLFFLLQLNQQTFLQITCSYTIRLEILDDLQDGINIFFLHIQTCLENQVVCYGPQITAQIPVVVNIPDDVFGCFHFFFRKIA